MQAPSAIASREAGLAQLAERLSCKEEVVGSNPTLGSAALPSAPMRGTTDSVTVVRFDDRMGEVDALMWAMEADPVLRSTVIALALLDGPPDRERLTARVRRSVEEIPRLHQVAVEHFGGTPRWVRAEEIDLGYHLRFCRRPDWSDRGLLGLVDEIAAIPFDRSRPLWQHTVVEDLPGGGAALVVKVHHSLTDGVGGMEIAAGLLFDLEADEPPPPPAPAPAVDPGPDKGRAGRVTRLAREARRQLRRLVALARGVVRLALRPSEVLRSAATAAGSALRAVSPFSGALSPLLLGRSSQRRYHEFPVALDRLRDAARMADARVNDAFLAALAGGLGRYHRRHRVSVDALRVTMPINTRAAGDDMVAGNRHAPSRFPLPVGEPDPVLRMQAIARQVTAERAEPALRFAEAFAGLLRRLPAALRLRLFGGMLKGVDVLASNVAGVTFPLYLAGARIAGLVAFGPPLGAALNVTLLSYLDRASIGVVTDTRAVPDPEVLLACLKEGFEEVLDVGRTPPPQAPTWRT